MGDIIYITAPTEMNIVLQPFYCSLYVLYACYLYLIGTYGRASSVKIKK